jgi:hypothetical protein
MNQWSASEVAERLNDRLILLGQSKVKYENGEPIPVYHGSPKGVAIERVDLGKLNPEDWMEGLFTTQDPKVAGGYSGVGRVDEGSNVHKFFLDIRNPLDLDAESNAATVGLLAKGLGVKYENYQEGTTYDYAIKDMMHEYKQLTGATNKEVIGHFRRVMHELGFDGATHIGGERGVKQFPTLEAAQAKAKATGGKLAVNEGTLRQKTSQGGAIEYYSVDKSGRETYVRPEALTPDQIAALDAAQGKQEIFNWEVYNEGGQAVAGAATEAGAKNISSKTPGSTYAPVYRETKEIPFTGYSVTGHRVWIAFNPDQVISATGTAEFKSINEYVKNKSRLLEANERLQELNKLQIAEMEAKSDFDRYFGEWLTSKTPGEAIRPRAAVKIPASTPEMPVMYVNDTAAKLFQKAWADVYPTTKLTPSNPVALSTKSLPKVIGQLFDEASRHPAGSVERTELEGLAGTLSYLWASRPAKGGSFQVLPVLNGESIKKVLVARRHELVHQEQMQIAASTGQTARDVYKLTDPGFLATHPLSDKILSEGGYLLDHYAPEAWTAEAVAYAASGEGFRIGLTPGESAQLVSDR